MTSSAWLESELRVIEAQLADLACPYLEDGGVHWLAELLLHPGGVRCELIAWLFTRFDPGLAEVLESNAPSALAHRIDTSHQKLFFLSNLVGVTNTDDLDVIRGGASQKKQILFWKRLLELVMTAEGEGVAAVNGDVSQENDDGAMSRLLSHPSKRSLDEEFASSCSFLDTLVRENRVTDLFSSEVRLFSGDIEAKLQSSERKSRPALPSIETLADAAGKMRDELDAAISQLQAIQDEYSSPSAPLPDQLVVEQRCRRVELAMNTFIQTADHYAHAHEASLITWCDKPAARLCGVGAAVRAMESSLERHVSLNKSLRKANQVSSSSLATSTHQELDHELVSVDSLQRTVDMITAASKRPPTIGRH